VALNLRDPFAANHPINLLTVLVAAYNEEKTILESLTRLRRVLDSMTICSEIIVVESNSSDATRAILKKNIKNLGIKLFFQEYPMGKGSAIRMGMEKMSGDVFLIFDADLEYTPTDIPKLLLPILDGATSFVLGTRHEHGKPIRIMDDHTIRPFIMNFAHKFCASLINKLCKVQLTDPFTMYKVFRKEVFENVKLRSNRFDFDWELVIVAIRRGAIPIEIPVQYKARSFTEGKKINLILDPITWLIALIKFRFIYPIQK
jgi:glycosyltransferase involved in cell wall biosynthesis